MVKPLALYAFKIWLPSSAAAWYVGRIVMPSRLITYLLHTVFLLVVAAFACLSAATEPFAVQVTDESNHRGIPMAVLETDNHIRLITDSAGWALFDEPGLMGRPVHFFVTSPGYVLPKDADGQTGTVVMVAPGQAAEVRMVRTMIAERLYRLTGQGVYRESTLLGKDVPLPFSNINGDVLGLGRAQVAPYQGKLVWVWSDVKLATLRNSLIVAGAAADLPRTGGLDPAQGVHLRYFTNDQEETLSLLSTPRGQHAIIEGLASVKNVSGAEHLLARYAFFNPSGECVEQGIAEFNARHTFDRKIVLGEEYTWQFPSGHAVEVNGAGGNFIYFAAPFCHTRVPASYEAALSPTSYEALAWSDNSKSLVLQQRRGPVTQADEARLASHKKLKPSEASCQLINSVTGGALSLAEGSVQWNACRQCWIIIGNGPADGATAGDVWYAEANDPKGPWTRAVQIATHAGHTFQGTAQLSALQQEGGRYLYFEGTLHDAAGPTEPLPRYQDNQLMYRLDVTDQRLLPAHGVNDVVQSVEGGKN
ncbi:MAG: hypothetical protein JWO94_2765 [Verrucomicrobiaceae bacterium]|nr:hypothetical protein [Verrucomicrobiaceae bacterium]